VTFRDRFFDRVSPEPNTGCWLWVGCISSNGYGQARVDGRLIRTHRLSWLIHHGVDPGSAHVLHRCDNPTCVNPSHLRLGTHLDNMRDMARKRRAHKSGARGQNNGSAKLSPDAVVALRAMHAAGTRITEVARAFGVSRAQARNVVLRVHWRHL
jgi:hypothetical protein